MRKDSAAWMLGFRALKGGLALLVTIVLSRYFTPDEFGRYALMLSIFSILTVFIESGVSSNIIQAERLTNREVATFKFVNFLVALVVFVVAILLFHCSSLGEIFKIVEIRLLLVLILLSPLSIVNSAVLRRELDLKSYALSYVFAYLASLVYVILNILLSRVELVVLLESLIIESALRSLFLHIVIGVRLPNIADYDLQEFRKHLSFSSQVLFSKVIDESFRQLDSFVITSNFGLADLGYFGRAKTLAYMSNRFFSDAYIQFSLPRLSKARRDGSYGSAFIGTLSTIVIVGLTFVVMLSFFPTFWIQVVFGEQWLISARYLGVLSVLAFGTSVTGYANAVLLSKGNSLLSMVFSIVDKIFLTAAIAIGLYKHSIYIYILASAIAKLLMAIFQYLYIYRYDK